MKKVMIVVVLLVLLVFSIGCGAIGWSLTPYASMTHSNDRWSSGGWNVGLSLTFHNGTPAYPAVPNWNSYIIKIKNTSTSSSSASSGTGGQENDGGNGHGHGGHGNGNGNGHGHENDDD